MCKEERQAECETWWFQSMFGLVGTSAYYLYPTDSRKPSKSVILIHNRSPPKFSGLKKHFKTIFTPQFCGLAGSVFCCFHLGSFTWLHSAHRAAEQENPVTSLVHLAISAGCWLGSSLLQVASSTSKPPYMVVSGQCSKGRSHKASEGMMLQNSHIIILATFY